MSLMETQQTPQEAGPPPAVRLAAAPSVPVRVDPLNLARRPFLNSRPVVRVSLILWMLGLLLLLVNVSLFWSYLSSSKDKRAEIAVVACCPALRLGYRRACRGKQMGVDGYHQKPPGAGVFPAGPSVIQP